MSLLLHEHLIAAMDSQLPMHQRLVVTPLLNESQVGSGSIDLRLGTEFIEIDRRVEAVVDPYAESTTAPTLPGREAVHFVPLGEYRVLHPGQFVLGATLEFLRLPAHLGAQVLSRSSWGRLGLLVATAVAVQPGFGGCLTLELVNTGSVPIRLYPGLRVAQLQIWSAGSSTDHGYTAGDSKYLAPLGPQSNRLAWEGNELERLRSIGRRLLGRS